MPKKARPVTVVIGTSEPNYAVKAGVVCLQVKLCDPDLSTLEVRFSRRGAIQIYVYLYLGRLPNLNFLQLSIFQLQTCAYSAMRMKTNKSHSSTESQSNKCAFNRHSKCTESSTKCNDAGSMHRPQQRPVCRPAKY